MRVVITTLIYTMFSMAAFAGNHGFRLNSGAPESLSNDKGDAYYNLISAEIFKRLEIPLNYIRLPSQRSLIQANSGVDDGNIARIEGMEKKWTNLVRVPESIIEWEFTAYTYNDNTYIRSWESLKDYPVGHVRGWQIYQRKLENAQNVVVADSAEQLFELLKNGRIRIALFEQLQSHYWFRKLDYAPVRLAPPLAKKPLYIYLNKKHRELVPHMSDVISEMKKDGTYQQIYNRAFGLETDNSVE